MIRLSVAKVFTPVLALSPDLHVHSVFASGFNLSNGSRTLIWVAPLSEAAYPASLGLGLDRDQWLDLRIQGRLTAGERVHVAHGPSTVLKFLSGIELVIDEHTTVQSTKILTGEVVSRPGYSLEIMQAIDADCRPQPEAYNSVTAVIDEHLNGALVALRSADDASARAHLRRVIGLGFGLTPTGDDSVIGALGYACMFEAELFQRFSAATAPLLDRTTAISATYLALAVGGHFSRSLADTLRGYAIEPMPGTLSGLFMMGHSSGLDTARGIVAAASSSTTPQN